MTQTLRANLAQLETQRETLKRQKLKPNAPAMVGLENQINATKQQIRNTEAGVAVGGQGSPSLSKAVAEYGQLDLERQFAQTMLTGAMQALDQARAVAASQQLYIAPYVKPSLPQSSTYPNRFQSIATVGAFAFAFWLVALLIIRSVRERFG